jgi:DNA-binding protein YbaB
MNGGMEVESITLNPALDTSEAAVVLKECINDATKNIQKRLAKTMMAEMGGF